MGKAHGLLDRVEVAALEVLDDREFEAGAIVSLADDGRDSVEASRRRRAPAPFARDQLVGRGAAGDGDRPNEDGHDDAERANRLLEFGQRLRIEVRPRLLRVGTNRVDPDLRRPRVGRDRVGAFLAEQGVEAATEPSLPP
jgi:hypothetical protein